MQGLVKKNDEKDSERHNLTIKERERDRERERREGGGRDRQIGGEEDF